MSRGLMGSFFAVLAPKLLSDEMQLNAEIMPYII